MVRAVRGQIEQIESPEQAVEAAAVIAVVLETTENAAATADQNAETTKGEIKQLVEEVKGIIGPTIERTTIQAAGDSCHKL